MSDHPASFSRASADRLVRAFSGVAATVVSTNDVVSPLSGLRAAVFLFRFVVHLPEPGGSTYDADVVVVPLLDDQLGESVRLSLGPGRGVVAVPRHGRELVFRGAASTAGTLVDHLPERWAHLAHDERARRGSLYVIELPLVRGDHVRLTAHAERAEDDHASAETSYRQNAGERDPFFVARPDLGPVQLEEQLPTF